MRVGILCHSGIGGSVRIACALASQLAQRGHAVELITPRRPADAWVSGPGVRVHALHCSTNGDGSLELEVDWTDDERADFDAMVTGVVRSERLQLLHAHYAVPFADVAVRVARRLGRAAPTTIATLHGTDVSVHGRNPAERSGLAATLRALDAVTTVSRDHARLARHLLGLPRAPTVIPNFIDLAEFIPARSREAGRARVAHVSNFRSIKDPRSLGRIFLEIRDRADAELWLVGDGPKLPLLRSMLSEAGVDGAVRWFGATTAVAPIMCQADVLLMSSVSESFCLAAAEAMASGVPVVGTRVGGLAEVLGEEAGDRLFPIGEHARIADAVVELLTDPRLRRGAGVAARRRTERFAADRVVPMYEDLYGRLLERTASAAAGAVLDPGR